MSKQPQQPQQPEAKKARVQILKGTDVIAEKELDATNVGAAQAQADELRAKLAQEKDLDASELRTEIVNLHELEPD